MLFSGITYAINENLAAGVDGGVATTGIATLDREKRLSADDIHIHWWEIKETKGDSPKAVRGKMRRHRKLLNRHNLRKKKARQYLKELNMPHEIGPLSLSRDRIQELLDLGLQPNIFGLRAIAVQPELAISDKELSAVLFNLVKHRGWKQTTKADLALSEEASETAKAKGKKAFMSKKNDDPEAEDAKKMLGSLANLSKKKSDAGFLTLGHMLGQLKLPDLPNERRRNRANEYIFCAKREDIAEEIHIIGQKRNLNPALIKELANLCLDQKASVAPDPGFCKLTAPDLKPADGQKFTPEEQQLHRDKWRSHANHPDFEKFRLFQAINNLSITDRATGNSFKLGRTTDNESDFDLTAETLRQSAIKLWDCHKQSKITYADLRNALGLDRNLNFTTLMSAVDKKALKNSAKKQDSDQIKIAIAAQKDIERDKTFADLTGKHAFDTVFGSDSATILSQPKLLDRLVHALLETDEVAASKNELKQISGLSPDLYSRAEANLNQFNVKRRRSHLCPSAARKLNEFLELGFDYTAACKEADFKVSDTMDMDDIHDPAVKKAVKKIIAAFEAVIKKHHCLPGRVVVETGREMALSAEKRDQRNKEQNDAEKFYQEEGDRFKAELGLDRLPNGFNRRIRLWRQQNLCCIYCGVPISKHSLMQACHNAAENSEIDHIINDASIRDSRDENLVLVHKKCNQNKTTRTALSFAKENGYENQFRTNVKNMHLSAAKKKRLLDESGSIDSAKNALRTENSWVAKIVLNELKKFYPEGEKHRVTAAPSRVTSLLRRALGVDNLKYLVTSNDKDKSAKKERQDDRNHGIDALMLAIMATKPNMVQQITDAVQKSALNISADNVRAIAKEEIEAVKQVLKNLYTNETWPHLGNPDSFSQHIRDIHKYFEVKREYKKRGVQGELHKQTLYGYECYEWMNLDDALKILVKKRENLKGKADPNGQTFDDLMKDAIAELIRDNNAGFDEFRKNLDLQAELVRHVQIDIAARLDRQPSPALPAHLAEILSAHKDQKLYLDVSTEPTLHQLPVCVAQRSPDKMTFLVPDGDFMAFSRVNLREIRDKMADSKTLTKGQEAIEKIWQSNLKALRDPWRNRALFDILTAWFKDQQQLIWDKKINAKSKDKMPADKDDESINQSAKKTEEIKLPNLGTGSPIQSFATRENIKNATIITRGKALALVRLEGILAVTLERKAEPKGKKWDAELTYRLQAAKRAAIKGNNAPIIPERCEPDSDKIVLYPGDLVQVTYKDGSTRIGHLTSFDVNAKRLELRDPLTRDGIVAPIRTAMTFQIISPIKS